MKNCDICEDEVTLGGFEWTSQPDEKGDSSVYYVHGGCQAELKSQLKASGTAILSSFPLVHVHEETVKEGTEKRMDWARKGLEEVADHLEALEDLLPSEEEKLQLLWVGVKRIQADMRALQRRVGGK